MLWAISTASWSQRARTLPRREIRWQRALKSSTDNRIITSAEFHLRGCRCLSKIPGVKTTALLALLIVSATFGGCDNVQSSPKRIDADGQSFLACHDFVWVGDEGGGLLGGSQAYKVTFTDAAGLSRTLRGVKKLEVSDLPRTVTARTPLNPTMLDKDGKRPIEGATYTWSDGSQARFHNGQWEPVEVPNDVCKPSR
jgi:hypothetical protein